MKKPRGEAILKNAHDKLQSDLWEFTRHTTFKKAAAWLLEEHGIKVGETTLHHWYSWYPESITLRTAATLSDQLETALKKEPELIKTAQQARRIAEINFELLAARDMDPALFSALRKGELERARLQLEREKHEWSKKTDAEKGLDALHEEIKGNPEALQHFEKLKVALAAPRK